MLFIQTQNSDKYAAQNRVNVVNIVLTFSVSAHITRLLLFAPWTNIATHILYIRSLFQSVLSVTICPVIDTGAAQNESSY